MMVTRSKYRHLITKRALPYWQAYLMLIPLMVWLAIFAYAPMGGIVIAFKKFSVIKGIANSPWVQLDNFTRLFGMDTFRQSIANTLIISIQRLVFGFAIPIVFAILLNEMKGTRLKRITQTVSYLPHFISWSVTGGLVYMLLSPSTGVVNVIIKALGLPVINFMGNKAFFRPIVFFSHIWKSMGWTAIIYMAAISGVDEQLYEAAFM
ncbi:MAG: sugar ABC transporter permease, partial [Bacteroidia bacterium]|nr:sugar ABC transporter permease [Bacteroidia bacterium]